MIPYVHITTEFLNNKTHFHFWKEEKTNAIKVNKLQFPFQPTRLSITSTPYTSLSPLNVLALLLNTY